MNNINYAGIAYALAAAITWGMVYVFDQRVLTKISPLNWLFIASLIMVIITFPIAILNWESVKNVIFSDNKHVIYFIIGAPILAALAEFFIYSAIQRSGASTAAIFEIAYPFFVAMFALLIFGEKINAYFWLGAVLMFLGAVVITRLS